MEPKSRVHLNKITVPYFSKWKRLAWQQNRGTANKITVPYFSKLKQFVQNDGKTPIQQGVPTKLLYPIDIFTVPYQQNYCTLSTFLLYPTFLKPLRRKGLRAPKSIQKRYKDFKNYKTEGILHK